MAGIGLTVNAYSSLRVQSIDDTVFMVSDHAHRPTDRKSWNDIE